MVGMLDLTEKWCMYDQGLTSTCVAHLPAQRALCTPCRVCTLPPLCPSMAPSQRVTVISLEIVLVWLLKSEHKINWHLLSSKDKLLSSSFKTIELMGF